MAVNIENVGFYDVINCYYHVVAVIEGVVFTFVTVVFVALVIFIIIVVVGCNS